MHTLLDDRGLVVHHEGEHLPASTDGPLVGHWRDHGGPGEPLGPAPLHGDWSDALVEGDVLWQGQLCGWLCGPR
jgi:hypothetical protein